MTNIELENFGEFWGIPQNSPIFGDGEDIIKTGYIGESSGWGQDKSLGNFGDKIPEIPQIAVWGRGQLFQGIWPH